MIKLKLNNKAVLVSTKFPHSWVFGVTKIGGQAENLSNRTTPPNHPPYPTNRSSQPLQRLDCHDQPNTTAVTDQTTVKYSFLCSPPTTTANPNLPKPNFIHLHKPQQNPISQYPLPLSSHPAINISISLLCKFFLIKTKQLYSII